MATTVFRDLFTEPSADTVLPSHTPDIGAGWVEVARTGDTLKALFTPDQCGCTGGFTSGHALYKANQQPAAADYDVICIMPAVSASADDPSWFVGRMTDANNFYALGVYPGNANPDVKLIKKVAGVVTVLASGNIAPVAGDEFKLEMRGTTIKAYRNGLEVLSAVDSALAGIGFGGLGQGNLGDISTDDQSTAIRYEDFRVEEPAAAPGYSGVCPTWVW